MDTGCGTRIITYSFQAVSLLQTERFCRLHEQKQKQKPEQFLISKQTVTMKLTLARLDLT